MRRTALVWIIAAALSSTACTSSGAGASTREEDPTATKPEESKPATGSSTDTGSAKKTTRGQPEAEPVPEGRAVATFAGGCFWCMEPPFEKLDGVDDAISGYTGGPESNPT
ncbi:MAG: peptide-methionine (S)-S-oxide reductase, partial [Myxococcota bacterium]